MKPRVRQLKINVLLGLVLIIVICSCKTVSIQNQTVKPVGVLSAFVLFDVSGNDNFVFPDNLPGTNIRFEHLLHEEQPLMLMKLDVNNRVEFVNIVQVLAEHGAQIRFAKLGNELSESEMKRLKLGRD